MRLIVPRDRYQEFVGYANKLVQTSLEAPRPYAMGEDGSVLDLLDRGAAESPYLTWDEPRLTIEDFGLLQAMALVPQGDWDAVKSGDEGDGEDTAEAKSIRAFFSGNTASAQAGDITNWTFAAREYLSRRLHDQVVEAMENFANPADLLRPREERQSWLVIEANDRAEQEAQERRERREAAAQARQNEGQEGVRGAQAAAERRAAESAPRSSFAEERQARGDSDEEDESWRATMGAQDSPENQERSAEQREAEDRPMESASEREERLERELREEGAERRAEEAVEQAESQSEQSDDEEQEVVSVQEAQQEAEDEDDVTEEVDADDSARTRRGGRRRS